MPEKLMILPVTVKEANECPFECAWFGDCRWFEPEKHESGERMSDCPFNKHGLVVVDCGELKDGM